jgi:CubicO group peptidase (beta-lactamase class C family)
MDKILIENINLLRQHPTALAASWQHASHIVWQKLNGKANLEEKIAVTATTAFPISSVTKHITAFLVWQLWKKQKLDLDTPINEFISQLPTRYRTVCIKHLVFHCSGLVDPYEYYEKQNWETNGISNADVVQLLERSEILFKPGSKFHYCNSNYILLALLCEKLYKTNFQSILQKQIFIPLQMDHSFLFNSNSQHTIKGYNKDDYEPIDNSWYTYGDGGINASLQDLQKWSAFCFRKIIIGRM